MTRYTTDYMERLFGVLPVCMTVIAILFFFMSAISYVDRYLLDPNGSSINFFMMALPGVLVHPLLLLGMAALVHRANEWKAIQ